MSSKCPTQLGPPGVYTAPPHLAVPRAAARFRGSGYWLLSERPSWSAKAAPRTRATRHKGPRTRASQTSYNQRRRRKEEAVLRGDLNTTSPEAYLSTNGSSDNQEPAGDHRDEPGRGGVS